MSTATIEIVFAATTIEGIMTTATIEGVFAASAIIEAALPDESLK